jgi:DNA invertase Pin-like site-specific DNA recombinase
MKGQEIGYLRVSAADQNTERQEQNFQTLELDKIFIDHASGKDANRPELSRCLEHLREGDTLHVHSIDRLARNLQDLLTILQNLTGRGVAVKFHKENLTFTGEENPFQQLQLQIIGAVAQFERAMIKERQREGIAVAKAAGKYTGRKAALSEAQAAEVRRLVAEGKSKASVAAAFKVSRQTLYRVLQAAQSPIQ